VWPAALIATGCLGLVAVVRLAAWPLVRVSLPPNSESTATAATTVAPSSIAPESVAAIASRDPFRPGRRPLLPAYDPLRLAQQLALPPPRPMLLLVGIVDGANPSAVVEGFPGVEGSRVVRVGDVVAGFAIKKVSRGQVMISGMDTTWVLKVREPWKP
jgi:hypothetical protein